MRILVAVKRVIDPCVAIRVNADGSGIDAGGVRRCMNPFDEIAVEAAVRLKESGAASEVVVVSCGSLSCQETLRTALAMGADRAILVEAEGDLSPLAVAKLLKALCDRESAALLICGKQAVDDDAAQVGQMIAALAGWPQASFASELKLADGKALVTRAIDGGCEQVQVNLPAVVTTELGLNEPRYATLPNIMKARKKPLQIVAAADLGGVRASALALVEVCAPPQRKAGVQLAGVAELVTRLRDEAKVIAGGPACVS